METGGDRLELAEVVGALRDSLATAQAQGRAANGPRFTVSGVDVEVTVEIGRALEGGGGVKFWVVQAGGRVTGSATRTHRILLSLKPAEAIQISGRNSDAWEEELNEQPGT